MPERQYFDSYYQASIFSNLVPMALTLVGPRVWMIIKGFFFSTISVYDQYSSNRLRIARHNSQYILSNYDRSITQESYSKKLIGSVWEEVRLDRLQLTAIQAVPDELIQAKIC